MTPPYDSNISSFKDCTQNIAFTNKLGSHLSIGQRLDNHNKHAFNLKKVALIIDELLGNEQRAEEQNLRSFLPDPSATQEVNK